MGRHTPLGPGGEFDLIRSILERAGPLPGAVRVGPGDDCAVLDTADPLAVSTDLSVEDVHFRRAWLTPEEIGWRAASSALSDLAAVAAEPLAVLVSLALRPEDVASGWGLRLMEGLERAAREFGAGLAGGDVARSPGIAVVDVVAIGRAPAPVRRSGARPGDEIWVTGALGGAGAAVRLLDAGQPLPDALRRAFAHPVPRIREALWLYARVPLHSMIDLSDGLAGDVAHLAAASGVVVELEVERVPVVEHATLDDALSAGEDYELCLTAPPGELEPLAAAFRSELGIGLTRVGRVRGAADAANDEPADGGASAEAPPAAAGSVWALTSGAPPRRLDTGGFSHFQAGP